jgi:hypothetical protein
MISGTVSRLKRRPPRQRQKSALSSLFEIALEVSQLELGLPNATKSYSDVSRITGSGIKGTSNNDDFLSD